METYIFVFPQKQNGLYSFVSNPRQQCPTKCQIKLQIC